MQSRETYSVTRLQQALCKLGQYYRKAGIKRLMQQEGLKPKAARRFIETPDSRDSKPVAENILERQFNPVSVNTAWTSDIIYIHTDN